MEVTQGNSSLVMWGNNYGKRSRQQRQMLQRLKVWLSVV